MDKLVNNHEQIYRDLKFLTSLMDFVMENFERMEAQERAGTLDLFQQRVNGLHSTVGA